MSRGLTNAIHGIRPAGALRASGFVPDESVDSHHPLQAYAILLFAGPRVIGLQFQQHELNIVLLQA